MRMQSATAFTYRSRSRPLPIPRTSTTSAKNHIIQIMMWRGSGIFWQ